MASKSPVVVLLYSSYGSGNVLTRKHTTYLHTLFVSAKKLRIIMVDGTVDIEERKRLWDLSGKQNYPQVFLRFSGEEDVFVGGYETVHKMVENETFPKTFGQCQKAPLNEKKPQRSVEKPQEAQKTNAADDDHVKMALSEKKVINKRMEIVRSALIRQDEVFFSGAFKGNEAKLNFDALIQIVMGEYVEPVGLSKAVKGLMIAQRTKWNIELLKIILIPEENRIESPNTKKHGGLRNLINLLVVFAVKADKDNLMSYLKRLDIFKDDIPRLVKLMQANGLQKEAAYLGEQIRHKT